MVFLIFQEKSEEKSWDFWSHNCLCEFTLYSNLSVLSSKFVGDCKSTFIMQLQPHSKCAQCVIYFWPGS